MKRIALALCLLAAPAVAHDHHPKHGPSHFYATWMMPDAPHASCCSDQDCGPAQARFINGHWQARFTDADEWVDVPDHKVERNRDMPDGQAHLCGFRGQDGVFRVFCFGAGAGG